MGRSQRTRRTIPAEARAYRHPASPRRPTNRGRSAGGRRHRHLDRRSARDVFALDDRGGRRQFSDWSPDDSRIVFSSARNGGGIFSRPAVGTGQEQILVRGAEWRTSTWTRRWPAGLRAAARGTGRRDGDVPGGTPAGAAAREQPVVLRPPAPGDLPDGRWLAYHSTESGNREVYVRPFPNVGRPPMAGVERWRLLPDVVPGRAVAVLHRGSRTDQTRAAHRTAISWWSIQTRPAFASAPPERLFQLREYVSPNPLGREHRRQRRPLPDAEGRRRRVVRASATRSASCSTGSRTCRRASPSR